jgi:outer membrane protein TolC
MWIVRLALRRPYTVLVSVLLVFLFGVLSIQRLQRDILPNIDIPVVIVIWNYPGLPARDMETRRRLLGLAPGDDHLSPLDEKEFEPAPGDQARARTPDLSLTDIAFRQRTELRQLDLLGHSYRQLLLAHRGQYLPQLTVAAGPTWTGLTLSSLVRNFTVSVALEYPLGGMSPLLVHGQVREAQGNLLATLAQQRNTLDSIRQETVSGRALLASAIEGILAARKLLAAATAQRDLAIGRYAAGVGTIIELTDAILNYVNARFQQIQAGYDVASARAQLQHALGEDG